jgi:enamine deaminase RidA (YjgF/YER057c/UK114 family)
VGSGDFAARVKQVFANLTARLDEAGASFNDVRNVIIGMIVHVLIDGISLVFAPLAAAKGG